MRKVLEFPIFPLFVCLGLVLALEASSRYTPVAFPYATLGIVFFMLVGALLVLVLITKFFYSSWYESLFLASTGLCVLCGLLVGETLLVLVLVLVILVVLGFGHFINWKISTIFLNLLLGFMCSVVLISGVSSDNIFRPVYGAIPGVPSLQFPSLPDIYLLVLDEYPSSNELSRQFGYNNSEFTSELSSRGYTVSDNYYTSYPKSELSMDSIMSMSYLSKFSNVNALFKDSPVLTELNGLGYTTVLLGSGWYPTSFSFEFDYNLQCFFPEAYKLNPLGYYNEENYWYSQIFWRDVVKFQYSSLDNISSLDSPTFTFAHIQGVHTPFSFDSNGGIPSYETPRDTLFIGQLEYTNRRILEFIDNLDPESIVMIVSDHGPCTETVLGYPESCLLDFSREEYSEYIKSRLSGFLAIRLPGTNLEFGPDQPNLFRTVFREFFHLDYTDLESRHFFSNNWCESNFPDIFEVTGLLEDK